MSEKNQRLQQMIAAMRETGRRVTPQRLAVLRVLAHSADHPGVEQIYQTVRRDFPTTSLATIYKTVAMLKEMGQVLELGFADWGSRYDGFRPQPHPHVVCTRCGAIVDPEFSTMRQMAQEMASKSGYMISHHRLDFFGLCPACQARD